jgi:group I intron endonuclease
MKSQLLKNNVPMITTGIIKNNVMKNKDNAIVGIYKIINPFNKVYVGQSTHIENRKKRYQKNSDPQQIKIHNSIKKYGWKQHRFEIIEQCILTQLNERERYWQDYYDVLGINGLNCKLTETKDKSGELSIETRNKISDAKKGCNVWSKDKKFSSEHCLLISNNKKGKGLWSKERKEKYLKTPSNYTRQGTPIIQMDNNWVFIKEWKNQKEACNFLNIRPSALNNCLKLHPQYSCGGFKWKYK